MKSIKRALCMALASTLIPVGAFSISAQEETAPDAESARKESAYYVVNEDFSLPQPNSYSSSIPSSWDMDLLGGSLGVSGNKSFTVNDTSEQLPVKMRRGFNTESGLITWEFTFQPSGAMDGTLFELRSGDNAAVSLEMNGSGLSARTPNGTVLLMEIGFGKINGVKAEVDTKENTCTIWTNGKRAGKQLPFLTKCTSLDNIYIETGKEATGSMDIGTVRVSKGFYSNERFITSPDQVPDEWTVNSEAGAVAPEKILGGLYPDIYSLKISDGDFLSSSGLSRSISYEAEELWMEYQFMIPEKMDDFHMELSGGGKPLITTGNKKQQFGYTLPDGTFQPVYDMLTNQWYHVMLKLTKEGGRLYINHKLKAENIALPFLKADAVSFETGRAATGEVYLDDILMKDYYPEPEDYVPAPETPDHGDYLVGMQSCSMWKEGSHFGWDWINPFEERHSYLGFYDEGSPEVKDWELKWMLEHGIDYELYCWYRPPGGDNLPIKYPRSAYALHEGYFNAKYSSQSKFAIAWENGGVGVSGSEDFRKNVVSYWLEQYFKDPRYLVVDNKPVVSIYNFARLKQAFGDPAGIRAELDYLRQACVAEGFDGCIVLMSSSTQNEEEMKEMDASGIDCIYNYSWGQTAHHVENQMSALESQRDLGHINMMATMAMGRDDTPWERTPGGFASVDDFGKLLTWARDEFIPSLPADSLGRKFVMFGNWNEYGEGHFLSPTNLHGFDYLDKIRGVFTGESEHSDTRPDDAQKERINHLYVQDRKRVKPYSARHQETAGEEVPDHVKLGFLFDDGAEGWTVAKQVVDFKAENGTLSGVADNTDPGLFSPANLGLAIGDVTHVRIRMRTSVPAPSVTLYFITETDTSWAESKSLKGSYSEKNGEFTDLILPTSGINGWKGKLSQVRLDPITEKGSFEIDSVEFLNKEEAGGIGLAVDGEQQFFTRPIVVEDGVTLVPAAEISELLGATWSESLEQDALQLLHEEQQVLYLPYGSSAGTCGDKPLALAKPAAKIDEEAYFPLRNVAEAMGYQVTWDPETGLANVVTAESGEEPAGPAEPDPPGAYNFNTAGDLQGWNVGAGLSGVKVAKGVLSLRSTSSDPTMTQGVKLEAAKFPNLYIRVKNGSQGTKFQMYFTTEASPGWKESQSVSLQMAAQSKEFKIYQAAMTSNDAWKGTVTNLRMDPTDNVGQMEFDYVILTDKELSDGGGGGDDSGGINILPNGTMDAKAFSFDTSGAVAEYSADTAYIGRWSLLVRKQAEGGALLIPAGLEQDKAYGYSFWVNLPEAGNVEVGTLGAGGEFKKVGEAAVKTANVWQKVTGSFTQGEALEAPALYLRTDTDFFYLDGAAVRVRQ